MSFPGFVPFAQVIVGIVLLFFGKKLFWIFVATVGFLFGLQLTINILGGETWLVLAVAFLFGAIGAFLAIVVQKMAIILAVGTTGGLLAMHFATEVGLATPLPLGVFLTVGIFAVLLATFLFDWTLITFSALAGASLILDPFLLSVGLRGVLWLVLIICGVTFQSRLSVRAANPV